MHSRVPQGSILGPLLFLTHTNDIQNVVTFSPSYLLVDDTKFIKSITSYTDRLELQENSDSLIKLYKTCKLSLNYQKCVSVNFILSQMTTLHIYDRRQPDSSVNFRDLGVLVSSDLSWADHCKCQQKCLWDIQYGQEINPIFFTDHN